MIKEFFKSTFRTLGRVFAYLVLGILAYFILTWFGISTAHASTLTPNNLQFEGQENLSENTYFYDAGNVSSYSWNNPVRYNINRSNAVYNNVTIESGHTYLLKWDIEYTTRYENQIDYSFNFVMFFGSTTATCDSIVEKYVVETSADDTNQRYTAHNRLWCYINSTISANYIYTAYFHVYQNLYSYNISFEFSEKDASSQDIIDNNNANFNKLIDQINQNNTQINNNLSDINDNLIDESPADFGILEDIKDYMPSNAPLTSIITLPLTILALELNSLGGTCNAWTIHTGSLLGNTTWTIPCINPGRYLTGYSWGGYDLWDLIDLMFCMYMGYEILMLIISAWEDITSLEDTFDGLYQPKHKGYQTKHNGERLE